MSRAAKKGKCNKATELGQSILRGAREALAFARGEKNHGCVVHVPEEIDVKAIRKQTNMSQSEFSRSYGFSKRSLEQWEQGRSVPTGAARVFLTVIAGEPEAVQRVLRGSTSGGGRSDQKRKAVSNYQSAGTEVERTITEIESQPNPAIHPKLRRAVLDGLRSKLENLKREIKEYKAALAPCRGTSGGKIGLKSQR